MKGPIPEGIWERLGAWAGRPCFPRLSAWPPTRRAHRSTHARGFEQPPDMPVSPRPQALGVPGLWSRWCLPLHHFSLERHWAGSRRHKNTVPTASGPSEALAGAPTEGEARGSLQPAPCLLFPGTLRTGLCPILKCPALQSWERGTSLGSPAEFGSGAGSLNPCKS